MNVPYVDLILHHKAIKEELLNCVNDIIDNGQFILGDSVKLFEENFAKLSNVKYAVGVANGTDALVLSMKALGIGNGDEVITTPNSFLASASSIILAGATPVFVDVNDDFNIDTTKIEKLITSKTKAIIPVHLTGRPSKMDPILEIAKKNNLFVIEDAAQAVRAEYKGQRVGSFGIVGCFSMHPLKNLSACGDGGVITTNNEKVYKDLLMMRNHGLRNRDECESWGYNSRLDSFQASILNVKLKYLEIWEKRRREIALFYQEKLKDYVKVPLDKNEEKSVYHTFIIQTNKRDELKEYLAKKGIDTKIHYPIPIHLQDSAKELGYKLGDFPLTEKQSRQILSLPIFPELTDKQLDIVVREIIQFFK